MTDKCPKCDVKIKPLSVLRGETIEKHYVCHECNIRFIGESIKAPDYILEYRKKRYPSTSPPNQPSLMKKITNFTKSAIKHVRSGMKNASEKEIDKRMEICKGCEFFIEGEKPRCSKCGCHLNLKARWESSKCPIDKW